MPATAAASCRSPPIGPDRRPASARPLESLAEALGGWCPPRSSKPLFGAGFGVEGGFDSHALPPTSHHGTFRALIAAQEVRPCDGKGDAAAVTSKTGGG